MTGFNSKIVVVTGAAGNLGRAVVNAFLDRGAMVFGLDYHSGRMDDIRPQGDSTGKFFPLDNIDVTQTAAVEKAAGKVHQLAGKPISWLTVWGALHLGSLSIK